MGKIKIHPCVCKHEFQDKEYGEGNRVHNSAPGSGGKSPARYRCTVCGTTREIGG